MKKVLWLASWYPNESDPFSGDFIKRQAEAVALYQPVTVVWAGKYLPSANLKRSNLSVHPNLEEHFLYYKASSKGGLGRLKSMYVYFKKHLAFIKTLERKNELPDLIHVHVAMRAGLIALYMKWKYKIPFVLTEHWSGYYEQSADSLFNKSFWDKYFTRRILKTASLLFPVSRALGEQISHYWAQVAFKAIPNVVNTDFFFPATGTPDNTFRFIHVSSLLYPKNPEGIVRAFSVLTKSGIKAELVLVGLPNPQIQQLISELNFPEKTISCTGEISYAEVGSEMRKSSALLLFSTYENMPCVILEALCTGIPVITTNVGGISEVIDESNGILLEPGNETLLSDAMKKIIVEYSLYNKSQISQKASALFSYQTVGKQIVDHYS